jgi:hypothetical protein
MINIKSSVRKERKRDEELNLKTDRNFEWKKNDYQLVL